MKTSEQRQNLLVQILKSSHMLSTQNSFISKRGINFESSRKASIHRGFPKDG